MKVSDDELKKKKEEDDEKNEHTTICNHVRTLKKKVIYSINNNK